MPPLIAELLNDNPIGCVDVGAARGIPAHWRNYVDHLRVHAFEPNAIECARLAERSHSNIRWYPTALAGMSGPRDLHVLATASGSSLLPPAPGFVELFGTPDYSTVVGVATLDCSTLDLHLQKSAMPGPHLLKLDTQGTELEILRALHPDRFRSVFAIELETEFQEAYEGQALFPDVHAFLQAQGFVLLDARVQRAYLTGGIEDQHYLRQHLGRAAGGRELTAQLHALDALYIRPLREIAALKDRVALARYATILQIYRYFDGIFWLLAQPGTRELFGTARIDELSRDYEAVAPRPKFLERTGRIPYVARRARRAFSYGLEKVFGIDGFDPPRVAWTHLYWPDS